MSQLRTSSGVTLDRFPYGGLAKKVGFHLPVEREIEGSSSRKKK